MTDQTNLLDSTSLLSEDAATGTAAPLILGVSPTSGATTSLTTVSDELTFTGSAVDGSTVTIYDGTTALGAVTANAQGGWSFATTSPLSDGAHAFSATATASGVTSVESAVTDVTVNSDIGSFSSLTDQWSTPISVDGSPYYVENGNVSGNAPWAITEVDDHTLQFTLKPGDLWPDNDSSRSEIAGGTEYAANSVLNVSYQLTVQPGAADPNLDWLILGQVHADDNSSIVASLQDDYPVFAFHLTGANGHKGGDYLGIQAFYLPSGSNNPQSVTSSNGGYLYLSPTPIVRGSAYSIQVEGSFQDNANGFVDVWINGVQVVAYHGPIGYGSSNYWKEGVYEGYTQTQPITVDYANTVVSSGPYTSGQVTVAYYLANQAALDAAGSVTISDTAAAVSSAIDTINADTHVSAITLLGATQLDLTAAQALGDTLALGDITNSSYGITVVDTAANLDALSTTQIAQFAAEGVTELDATDADLSLTLAQREALSSDGISVLQPYSGGTTEAVTYNASGGLSSIDYQGLTGRPYTSFTVTYGSNGKATSASYSNGMTENWTYDDDSSYSVEYAGVTGQAFTSYSVDYGTNGKPTSATYSDGMTGTWTYDDDGSYSVEYADVPRQAFISDSVDYGTNGKPTSATYSDGMTGTWSYNADGSYSVQYSSVVGQAYTSYSVDYGTNGKPTSATYSDGMTGTWSYNADGSYLVQFSDVVGQAYTSYSVNYGTNYNPTSAAYSNGMTETWSYDADGSLSVTLDGITGTSFTSEMAVYNSAISLVAKAVDQSSGAGVVTLFASNLTISTAANSLGVTAGADTFALNSHTSETINATGFGSEVFNYGLGFGDQTISGFSAGGGSGDTLSLGLSLFSGLSILNTAAANAALLFSSGAMAQSGSAVTITDLTGDTITLNGQTTTALIQSASSVFKFA